MPSLTSNPARYRAYLLRMWRAANGDWRATLESPQTSQRRSFASLDELMAFLVSEAGTEPFASRSSPAAAATQAE